MIPSEYYDLDISPWSKAAGTRFIMALVECEGIITCTFPSRYGPGGKIGGVCFRIQLPPMKKADFEGLYGEGVRYPAWCHLEGTEGVSGS